MTMKNIHVFLFWFFFIPIASQGQEVEILLNKQEYKVNEQIGITFQINTRVDSIGQTDFSDFDVLAGPSQTNSMSMINGVASSVAQVTYILKAKRTGTFKIKSPKFFQGNGIFIGNDATIVVKGKITERDIKKAESERFANNPFKPKGTARYNTTGRVGYIEVFNGFTWEYYRELNSKEIKKLKKIR